MKAIYERKDIMFLKTKMKEAVRVCAAALAAMMLLGGCGTQKVKNTNTEEYQADSNLNPLGETPICKNQITLKIMKAQDSLVEDFYTNKYTKKIEEYGNVKLEFELVPSADMMTKLNLIMNSGNGDLPDVIITPLNQSQINSFSKTGMIIPLNRYYEHSSKYLKEKIDNAQDKEILKRITAADGNIYSIPRYNESLQNEFENLIWIYKPWLDKLGLKVPETVEEYKAVLKAFKDNDMNGNGDPNDEIPLVDTTANQAVYCIMNSFVTFHNSNGYLVEKNDKLSFAFMDDRWKQGLKYMNELCTEGLLTPISFTMDTQQFKTLLASDTNKVGSFAWTSTSCLPASSARRSEYVAVNLKQADNNSFIYRKTEPEQIFFITKGCKNPEAAFRIGDLMCSKELTLWSRFGEKGVDWVEPSADEKGLYDFLGYHAIIKPILQWGSIQNSHWDNITPGFRTYEVAAGMVVGNDASQVAKANAVKSLDLMNRAPKKVIGTLIYNNDETEEYNDIMLGINSYVTEKLAHFIAGNENIDKGWDGYIKELKNMGSDRVLNISQTAYDRMQKR